MMEQMAAPSRERSLRSMMEHLLSLDETAWYLYAWSRDPLEGRFSREQKLAYGFRAAECGRSEAQLILGKTDVWDIAAGMGLKVLTPQVPGGRRACDFLPSIRNRIPLPFSWTAQSGRRS